MTIVRFPTENSDSKHEDGMCKGYCLAWLKKCQTKVPTSEDEMPTRREASFRMLQYDWLFEDTSWAKSAKNPNVAVLKTTKTSLVSKGKHKKNLFAKKGKKFRKTATLVANTTGAGYLVETEAHAMAAVNDGGSVVFFDPNEGQYVHMSGGEFISFYEAYVVREYSTSISEYYRIF